MRARVRRWLRLGVALLAATTLAVAWVRTLPHPPLSSLQPRSVAVRDHRGALLRLTLASDDRYRLWTPLADIPNTLVDAVLLQEDQWFHWHLGVNPWSLCRAAWVSYVRQGPRQGGSTLTMQLARLLWRLDTKTPRGKFLQIARALQLEINYSKRELLEAYLNYAPYGGNVEGAGTASLIYFGKDAAQLTLPEALTLAVLPQDPAQRGPTVRGPVAAEIPAALRTARDRLFAQWLAHHPRDRAQAAQFALPLAFRAPRALPFRAPHFVDYALQRARLQTRREPTLSTTLDHALQRVLERRLALYLERARKRGIDNAAALLIDTRSMAVRALVGSADYRDARIHGQVNGTRAKRSPGSTLKPFIYALGMDQGILHPASVLRDVPSAFGPFTPENFDGRFMGPVTATEALIRSRNVPAVAVAAQLKNPGLYAFLRQAGVQRMASEQHYGLALVLGGGDVTMEELARLYAMLSNDGLLRPMRWLESDPQEPGQPLLSAEASFMVRDMLRQNPRPDLGAAAQLAHLPVAWKTGTSWGFHDAWTVGIVGPYVLVVWLGHFDGAANPALIGIEAAAPLFFEMVDALQAAGAALNEPPRRWPLNLKRIEICRASGDLPNAWCTQRGETWFIPGKSPIRVSSVHRAVAIDARTGLPACTAQPNVPVRLEIYEYWPSDLARVFAQAGIPRRQPPTNPACPLAGTVSGSAPRIQSPLRAVRYTIRLLRADQSHVSLRATADADVRALHWFVDDQYLGGNRPEESLDWLPPQSGTYRIRVVDDHGRGDGRDVVVDIVD